MSERGSQEPPETASSSVLYESGRLEDARVTVCITLYDYARTIRDAMMSVYDQTLDELALVVLDDRSTDDGAAHAESWMRSYGSRFAGLRLAQHEHNQGLARTRNGAVSMSASELVLILDADNLLYPRCAERLAESLEGSDYGFAYSIIEQFGETRSLVSAHPWDVEFLKKDNYVDAMAMVRKSIWAEVGGYTRMQVAGWEDYDFWCKCVEAGYEGLLVPEILSRYRLHGTSMLRSETNEFRNAIRMREEMKALHPWLQLKDIAPPQPETRGRRRASPYLELMEQARTDARGAQ